MAISQDKKDQVAKLLDGLNLGTKKAAVGQVIIALIEDAADGGVPAATTTAAGVVKKMEATTDTEATTVAGLVTDINAFFAKARDAGLM